MHPVVVGIFVGGRGRRMGGCDKSALPAPDGGGTLLSRLLAQCAEAGLAEVLLVGGEGGAHHPELPRLLDDPPGQGPLGGLAALLAHAGPQRALALSCDLPYLQAPLLSRLASDEQAAAEVLSPCDPESGKWEPLCARYDAPRVLPKLRALLQTRQRALQALLRACDTRELVLNAHERRQLRDWDTPSDLTRS